MIRDRPHLKPASARLLTLESAENAPNPTLTLLANSSAGAASAAKGATDGLDGRGSTSQETTRTTLIATAIRIAQCLAVCSPSILAETLGYAASFSSP